MKKKFKKIPKRGRPRGSKNKIGNGEEIKKEIPYIPPKSHKFLGYCYKCKNIIGSNDLVTKTIYVCPFCGNRKIISSLKKERAKIREVNSKREFLKDTLNVNYHDMPALEEPEVKL